MSHHLPIIILFLMIFISGFLPSRRAPLTQQVYYSYMSVYYSLADGGQSLCLMLHGMVGEGGAARTSGSGWLAMVGTSSFTMPISRSLLSTRQVWQGWQPSRRSIHIHELNILVRLTLNARIIIKQQLHLRLESFIHLFDILETTHLPLTCLTMPLAFSSPIDNVAAEWRVHEVGRERGVAFKL